MNKDLIRQIIENSIKDIELKYQLAKGLILTEDDLKAIIFHKLSSCCPELLYPKDTADRFITASMLHTELSWYDENGKLTIKPDITILEPKHLSILHKSEEELKLPSKACSFGSSAILMELKFIKNEKGIRETTVIGAIKNDVDKIKRLFSRLERQGSYNDVFCYFIIFNKTDKKCPEFDEFINTVNQEAPDKYKIIYATGNVIFNN